MARSSRSEVSLAEMAYARSVSYTPVTDTSAYADGDMIGTGASALTLFEAERPKHGMVAQCLVFDLDKQNADLDIILFSQEPGNTTFINNAALDIDDADLVNIIGRIHVYSSDYVDFADNSVAQTQGVLAWPVAAGQTVYAVTRCGGTPTYTTAAALKIMITLCED